MVWLLVVPLVQNPLQDVVCVDLDVVVVGEEKCDEVWILLARYRSVQPGMGTGTGEGTEKVGRRWKERHTYLQSGWMDGWKSVDRAGTAKPLANFLQADTRKTDTAVKKPLLVGTEYRRLR